MADDRTEPQPYVTGEDWLAPSVEIRLDDTRWNTLVELLDRPARPDPDLAAFLARRSISEDDESAPELDEPEVSGG